MFHTIVRAASLSLVFAILPTSEAFAHCFVGARFLPATLITDDPCIADEMSLPRCAEPLARLELCCHR
jgi:hypothetical protein